MDCEEVEKKEEKEMEKRRGSVDAMKARRLKGGVCINCFLF